MQVTLEELKQMFDSNITSAPSHSFEVGHNYLIRTVTFYYCGYLKDVTDSDLVLSDASWIANTGRFHDCLKNGNFEEVEPFVNDVIVPRGSIIDATFWHHPLPKDQK